MECIDEENKIKVSYCGTEGAYAFIAARKLFPKAELVPFSSFEGAYHSVMSGKTQSAVLPIKNNYAGKVESVVKLIENGNLKICGNLEMNIDHCLVGTANATKESVKKVLSHPKALHQCDDFIKKQGYETVNFSNTALATQCVESINDPEIASISSEETAKIFGLKILARNISTLQENKTTFVVLKADKTS